MSVISPVPQPPLDASQFDDAKRWLREMSFIRAFEAEAQALSRSDPPRVAGSMHLCAGQEAVPVGTIAGLQPDDQIIATYRGHGWALASGLDPLAVMAEICHKASGINGGRAGSAYFMAPWTRFVGENSIVGAGTTIACGVALANLLQRTTRLVAVSIGDGALNQGSVHEAMALAAAKALPVLFIVENNGWSELTATADMFRISRLAQRAAGYGIPSATVKGHDPFLVRDAVAAAAERARQGRGPTLLEFLVPRLWGHYNRDIEHYRPAADRAAAAARDPLVLLSERLAASGAESASGAAEIVGGQAVAAAALAAAALAEADPVPGAPGVEAIAPVVPFGAEAPRVVEEREMKFIEAVNLAMRSELQRDPRAIVFGEDVGKSGGIFQASRFLQRDFGAERVFDMPIAENAILGAAVGAALAGQRPIAEIMWADFIFVALDQLVNQAANVRCITGGRSSVPMVVRTQQGATPGSCAQHSQSIEALLAHVPGLKVAVPSCPADAYALLRAAAADPDPCIVIESRALYQSRGVVAITEGAEPVGRAAIRRSGGDALIVAWGGMVDTALQAAADLEREGIEVCVLDLRWIVPLDEATLVAAALAVKGRVVVVHEAVRTGGFGAEIVARLTDSLRDRCPLRIRRVATPDVRMPAAPALQRALLPGVPDIVGAVREVV
jgi:2-oxoisovalerate dehydrogenase E1 component